MVDIGAWLTDSSAIDTEQRAALAWRRINRAPESIQLTRRSGGTKTVLSAQTVRVEYDSNTGNSEKSANTSATAMRSLTLFGIRGHSTLSDTDVKRGDTFMLNGGNFRVVDVMLLPGEIQASCLVMDAGG